MKSLYSRLAALTVVLTAAVSAATTAPASANSALSPDRVLFVLAVARVPVRTAEVQFLTPIVLKHPRTTLRLEHIERWQSDSALARISCAAAGECLPFFVVVHWDDPAEREAALGPVHKSTPPQAAKQPEAPRPVLVRAGQSATLLLENAKMRIATPIICLQSGRQGQQIRVSSLDHKRIVMAEVVDLGVLKGTL